MAWDTTKIEKDRANPLTAAEWNAMVTDQKLRATKTQYQYIHLPASKWTVNTPLSMGGTGAEYSTETLGNGIERTPLRFGYAASQYAYCTDLDMPEDWDGGALEMFMDWETTAADTSTNVMLVYGARVADGSDNDVDLSDLLFTLTDTNTGAGYRNKSAAVALASITGTGNHIPLKLTRDYSTSTLKAEIKFMGVWIRCIVVKV
jgi:hypothetical protein